MHKNGKRNQKCLNNVFCWVKYIFFLFVFFVTNINLFFAIKLYFNCMINSGVLKLRLYFLVSRFFIRYRTKTILALILLI